MYASVGSSQLSNSDCVDSGFRGVKRGTDIAGIPDSTESMPTHSEYSLGKRAQSV